jgi:hypothetical protein
MFDCHLYRQPGRLILHVVNLTNPGTWRPPVHELIPSGRLTVRVRLPEGVTSASARLLVADQAAGVTVRDGWAAFEIPSVLDHEVAVIE